MGANFSTGIDAFDSIHDQAILSSVTRQAFSSWSDWFILRYENGWVNLEELARRYTASELDDEIDWVETNMLIGGASRDITLEYGQDCGDCWTLTFTKAWGDCPSGCIHSASATCIAQMEGDVVDSVVCTSSAVNISDAVYRALIVLH